MDILSLLPKTQSGNHCFVIMTDRYSKVTRTVPVSKTTALHAALTFIDNWIIPYGFPDALLTDNGPRFVSKFFNGLCGCFNVKKLTTTAYHAQTNGQTEWFNKKIVAQLRQCVKKHEWDWDLFVQSLIYVYKRQVHRSTEMTPFSLSLTPDARSNATGPSNLLAA